jgi:hypothetical protein
MKLLYFTNGGINGFDKFGHFLRANLQVTPSCTTLVPLPGNLGCLANWGSSQSKAVKAAQLNAPVPKIPGGSNGGTAAGLTGVPTDAQGDLAGAAARNAGSGKKHPHAPSLSATKDLLNTIIGKPGHVSGGGTPSGTYTTPSQGQAP